jgi:ribosome-associated toxin RatA of RatAB toxin-antitoxin module
MTLWEHNIEIAAPPARIWAVMSDVARWPEWTPSMESVAEVSSPLSLGGTAKVKAKGVTETRWTVTEWIPDQGFVWETKVRGARTVGGHTIAPLADGRCRVTLSIEVLGMAGAIFKPLISRTITRNMEMEANGLKQRSEAGE